MTTLERIEKVIQTTLNNTNLKIEAYTTANDIDGWDSISNLLIVTNLEKEFNTEFPLDVIYNSKTINDWLHYLDLK